MDIHKPKPIHNWREFLKEYAIIVLGVLTALGAEQAVEWLHWHSEVAIARKAIVAEVADNNAKYVARRIAFAPCMERQISEAGAIISDIEAKRNRRSFTSFHISIGSLLSDSEWQSERASQALTHFPRSELAVLSRYYARLESFDGFREQERAAWRELSILGNPTAELEPAELNRLRVSLIAAREAESQIILNSELQLRTSEELGIATPPVEPLRVKSFCSMDEERYLAFIKAFDVHKSKQIQ